MRNPESYALDPEQEEAEFQQEEEQEVDDFDMPKEFTESLARNKAKKDKARLELKEMDMEIITDWLAQSSEEIDPEMIELFKKALKEKGEEAGEEINQIAELLMKLPIIFKSFDQKITSLTSREGFSKEVLSKKSIEIKKAFVTSVANGHLDAQDVVSMVSEVEIFETKSDDPERQKKIDVTLSQFGYDSTMFVDLNAKKIYIVDETLKDKYIDPVTKKEIVLDFKHMINHEIAHPVAEITGLTENAQLIKACDRLVASDDLFDTQSMHIRNTLRSKGKMPSDRMRIEIIADYTALYLKSDGSFFDFMAKCLKMTDLKAAKKQLGINEEDINSVLSLNEKDDESKEKIIEKLTSKSEKFAAVWETYEIFYQEISQNLNNKEMLLGEEDEEDTVLENGGLYSEPNTGAQSPPGSKSEEGFLSSILGLVKAVGEEVGGKSIPSNSF